MTAIPSLKDMALLTVQDPATAAQRLMSLGIDRGTLWTAVFLTAVLDTLLHSATNFLVSGPSPLPGLFDVPAVYFFVVGGGLVLSIVTLFWAGRAFGGQGSMEDIMIVIVWLQFMSVLVQAAALILLLTIPALSVILVLAATFVGLWILVHFVDQAHRFFSLGKTVGVLLAAFVGMVIGVSILLSKIGVGTTGV